MSHKQAKRQRNACGVEMISSGDHPLFEQLFENLTPADVEAGDSAADGDEEWFAAHPGETRLVRDPYPGEFRAETPPGHYCVGVDVLRTAPNVLSHMPTFLPLPTGAPDYCPPRHPGFISLTFTVSRKKKRPAPRPRR